MGVIAAVDGLDKSPSFTVALGRLEPASFDLVWNKWPLGTALIWMQLQNIDIKQEHHRAAVARAAASSARPHI